MIISLFNFWDALAKEAVISSDRVVEISNNCPKSDVLCQVKSFNKVFYPSRLHKRGEKIYVNAEPSTLFVDRSNIASGHLAMPVPANLQIDIYRWKSNCGEYVSFFQGERIIYQDTLSVNQMRSRKELADNMSLFRYNFTLPAGDVSIQIDGNGPNCKFIVTAGSMGIGKDIDKLRDLKINRAVIQRGLGSVVDLTSLSVTPFPKWNRDLFNLTVDQYCSKFRNNKFERDYDDNYIRDLGKTIERQVLESNSIGDNGFNVEVCDSRGYSANLERRLQELYAALVGPNSFKYFVETRFFDRDSKSTNDSTLKLPSATMNAIADALDVSVLNLYVEGSEGNCGLSQMVLLPLQMNEYGMCQMSGSNVLEFGPSVAAGAREISAFSGRGGRSLRASVAGLIPVGAQPHWQADTEDFVKVKVTGEKSWVGNSSGLWEVVYLKAYLIENRSKLVVDVDGTVASGAGSNVPPESDFVQSMDRTPGYNLDQFAQEFNIKLKSALIAPIH